MGGRLTAVNEVARVDKLEAAYHLVGKHEDSLQAERDTASLPEDVFKACAE